MMNSPGIPFNGHFISVSGRLYPLFWYFNFSLLFSVGTDETNKSQCLIVFHVTSINNFEIQLNIKCKFSKYFNLTTAFLPSSKQQQRHNEIRRNLIKMQIKRKS